ncbi:MAG: ester cyclase [Bdellovibrionales bacterium]
MWKVIATILIASSSPADAARVSAKEIATEAASVIFFKRNPDAVDRYVAQDYIQHQPRLASGRKPFKEYLTALFRAFPDYKGKIENVVAEGDLVSFHFSWEGTHQGCEIDKGRQAPPISSSG